jgi:hypothetical protein
MLAQAVTQKAMAATFSRAKITLHMVANASISNRAEHISATASAAEEKNSHIPFVFPSHNKCCPDILCGQFFATHVRICCSKNLLWLEKDGAIDHRSTELCVVDQITYAEIYDHQKETKRKKKASYTLLLRGTNRQTRPIRT